MEANRSPKPVIYGITGIGFLSTYALLVLTGMVLFNASLHNRTLFLPAQLNAESALLNEFVPWAGGEDVTAVTVRLEENAQGGGKERVRVTRPPDPGYTGIDIPLRTPIHEEDAIHFEVRNDSSQKLLLYTDFIEKETPETGGAEIWRAYREIEPHQSSHVRILMPELKLNPNWSIDRLRGNGEIDYENFDRLEFVFFEKSPIDFTLGPIEASSDLYAHALWGVFALPPLWFILLFAAVVDHRKRTFALAMEWMRLVVFSSAVMAIFWLPGIMRHASRDPYFPIVALAGIAITEIAIRWFYPVKPFTRQLIAYISPWYVPALFTVLGVQTPLMFVFFMAACLPMLGTLELREVVTSVVYMGLFSAVFHNSIILPGGVTAIVSSMLAFLVALAWASWHHQSASRLEYDELKQQHNAVTIEKETLEEELRHAQKMEAIGLLASGVAHDFNNFLMTINGHSELALATIDPGDPAVDHFKAIKEAGERAASLTKQLLTFSRKQVNNPQILHVNDILAIQRKFLPRLIGENIKVIVEPDEEVKPILADPGLLEQAILNLALNARDAMPEGGRLTIRSYAQAVTASSKPAGILIEPGDYSVIEVEDEGVGIVPENRERIFDPFFTTKPKGKGTGLGLSTVYGFLQKCGGGVRVESEPGRGSIFSLYFPSIDHPANGFEKIEVNVERYQGSETILLVEDDPNVRALTRKSLEAYRYRVIEMENGAEALQFFGSGPHNIDLVLTDIVMPGISGKRLAEEVRRLIPGIKIVYMSGYTDNQLSEKDLSVKGCAFLQKPFNQSALLKTIRDVLSSA